MPRQRTEARDETERRAIINAIRHIVRTLRLAAREAEKRVGLSGAQLFALSRLADGRIVSLAELARRTLTDPSTVSVLVSRLQERKLVSRTRAADDGRRVDIAITAEGRRVLRRAPGVAQDKLMSAIDGLALSQRRTLAELLDATVRAMGVGDEPADPFFEELPQRPRPKKKRG